MGFLDDNGGFTDDFRGKLPEILGDEFKDFKDFDNIHDVQTLVKNYANTKSAYGKKLDNVIQRPAKDAKPEDVSTFQKALLKELGAVDKEDDLKDLNFRDGIPDGVELDNRLVDSMKKFILEEKMPKPLAAKLTKMYNNIMMQSYTEQKATQEAETKAQEEAAKAQRQAKLESITQAMPGDKMTTGLRDVLKIVDFMADDDLKAKIKASNLYDNPTLENFEKAGISLDNIIPFSKLSKSINIADMVGTGNSNTSTKTPHEEAMLMYPNAPWMWPKE